MQTAASAAIFMQRRNTFTNDVYAEGMHSQTTIDDKKLFNKNEIMKEEGPFNQSDF